MHEEPHIPDQDLLRAADGELSSRREAEVRAHLTACWQCRTRLTEIEASIADVVHLYRSSDAPLPPVEGPRALLKAQLATLSAGNAEPRPFWLGYLSAAVVATAAVAVVTIAISRGPAARWFERQPAASRLLAPQANLTPGATLPVTREDVCAANPRGVRMVPVSLQQQVFREYGLAGAKPEAYEVDYLITPELGGSSDIRNLWPQPYSSNVWNAHVKDALEERLHQMVCAGEIDLETAQRDIATNWILAYKKYFQTDRPLGGEASRSD
jgi:hypothetical protein